MTTSTDESALPQEGAHGEEEPLVDPDAPVLAAPPELVVDEAATLRLERQLALAPDHVVGVIAPRGELRPGASIRTAAERAAMLPPDVVVETDDLDVDGAVLMRPGISFELHPTRVQVGAGRLLLDRGAFSCDPWRPVGPIEVAVPEARPPFRWRPVVVLLGLETDLDLAETARGLANGLMAREVEARVALPDVPDGSYLTRPCRPVAESLRVLDPDVVIAIDPAARSVASDWCGDRRSATVVELTQDITYDVRLVSWRIGEAQGRLRARIGRGVGPGPVAELVNRLCSGPQPVPPSRSGDRGLTRSRVTITRSRGTAAPTGTVVAVGGSSGTGPHLSSVVGELAITGTVHRATADALDPELADTAALVLVSSSVDADAASALRARRSAAGRPTVLDVEYADVVDLGPARAAESGPPASAAERPLELDVSRLADLGLVVAPSRPIAEAVRARGARTLELPHLLHRMHILELERAAELREPPAVPVIGWWIGSDGAPPPATVESVTQLVTELAGTGVRVEVVADPEHVPAPLTEADGVSLVPGDPSPEQLAAWTVQLWTPPSGWAAITGDLRAVAAAGLAGVPTVLEAANRAVCGGLAEQGLVIGEADGPAGWAAVVRRLLDDEDLRGRRSRRARDASQTIYGREANRLRVDRLLGWARQRRGG